MNSVLSVGILLFNDVEVLDFAGPFEVFSLAEVPVDGCVYSGVKAFAVRTVTQDGAMITARNGLKVQPAHSFADAPRFDVVIVPGGYGAEAVERHNPAVIAWIKARACEAQVMASVCTGAFLLAEAGLLNGKRATTHWRDTDILAQDYPTVEVTEGVKFVDQGSIITAGGISAGINMSFYLLRKLVGRECALATAKRMEYDIVI